MDTMHTDNPEPTEAPNPYPINLFYGQRIGAYNGSFSRDVTLLSRRGNEGGGYDPTDSKPIEIEATNVAISSLAREVLSQRRHTDKPIEQVLVTPIDLEQHGSDVHIRIGGVKHLFDADEFNNLRTLIEEFEYEEGIDITDVSIEVRVQLLSNYTFTLDQSDVAELLSGNDLLSDDGERWMGDDAEFTDELVNALDGADVGDMAVSRAWEPDDTEVHDFDFDVDGIDW